MSEYYEENVTRQERMTKARRRLDVKMNRAAVLIQANVRRMIVKVKYAHKITSIAKQKFSKYMDNLNSCLLYTSDAADE